MILQIFQRCFSGIGRSNAILRQKNILRKRQIRLIIVHNQNNMFIHPICSPLSAFNTCLKHTLGDIITQNNLNVFTQNMKIENVYEGIVYEGIHDDFETHFCSEKSVRIDYYGHQSVHCKNEGN